MRALILASCLALCACSTPVPDPVLEPDESPPPAPTTAETVEILASAAPSASQTPAPDTSAPRPAQATTAKPGFKLPPDIDVEAVAGTGDELYLVLDTHSVNGGKVTRIKRSGEQLVNKGPGGSTARIRITDVGGKPTAVAIGEMGSVAIYRAGAWDYRLAPAIEGEAVGGVAIAKNGTVYVAGASQALYVRQGESWTTHRYGSSTRAARSC